MINSPNLGEKLTSEGLLDFIDCTLAAIQFDSDCDWKKKKNKSWFGIHYYLQNSLILGLFCKHRFSTEVNCSDFSTLFLLDSICL